MKATKQLHLCSEERERIVRVNFSSCMCVQTGDRDESEIISFGTPEDGSGNGYSLYYTITSNRRL